MDNIQTATEHTRLANQKQHSETTNNFALLFQRLQPTTTPPPLHQPLLQPPSPSSHHTPIPKRSRQGTTPGRPPEAIGLTPEYNSLISIANTPDPPDTDTHISDSFDTDAFSDISTVQDTSMDLTTPPRNIRELNSSLLNDQLTPHTESDEDTNAELNDNSNEDTSL